MSTKRKQPLKQAEAAHEQGHSIPMPSRCSRVGSALKAPIAGSDATFELPRVEDYEPHIGAEAVDRIRTRRPWSIRAAS
jgi:hypothetical protein